MDTIINGRPIADQINQDTASSVANIKADYGITPRVVFLACTHNNATKTAEMELHIKAANRVGISACEHEIASDATTGQMLSAIKQLNQNPKVHGVMPIVPLPEQIDDSEVLSSISRSKEIEGLQEHKNSLLELTSARQVVVLASLLRVLQLLDYDLLAHKTVLIMERRLLAGNIVVNKLLNMLQQSGVSLDICCPDQEEALAICTQADLLMTSVDTPQLIDATYIKPQAIVVDFNPITLGEKFSASKKRLVPVYGTGLAIDSLQTKAKHIIPTLGGIGPIALALLMRNVVFNCYNMVTKQC